MAIIWAATNGYLDDVPTPRVREFETGFFRHLESGHPELLPRIVSDQSISEATAAELKAAVLEYRDATGFGREAE